MRRNTEEVKAELSRRLDEYNEKRRARRKMATVCITVCLCAAVTVAAVPAMVAREKNVLTDEYRPAVSDKLDDITEHYAGDVQTDEPNKMAGANDGDTGKIQGVAPGSPDIIEGVDKGTTEKIEGAPTNGTPGSAGDMRVTFRDFPGISGAKAEPIVRAYEALELERVEEFSGEVILTFDIRHGAVDTVTLGLTDKDELIINGTAHTASNMQLLKDALKDAGVLE